MAGGAACLLFSSREKESRKLGDGFVGSVFSSIEVFNIALCMRQDYLLRVCQRFQKSRGLK